eukprot:scaffold921_cov101-Isochrysis_galbana.AAC.7
MKSRSSAAHSCGVGAGLAARYFAHRCRVECRNRVASTKSTPGSAARRTEARSARRMMRCCAAATRTTDSRWLGGHGPKAQKMTRGEAGSTGGAARSRAGMGHCSAREERQAASERWAGGVSVQGGAAAAGTSSVSPPAAATAPPKM